MSCEHDGGDTRSSNSGVSFEIVHHEGHVRAEDRWSVLDQRPITIWLTGLSAAGKSTLAFALERKLLDLRYVSYVLDGDNVRHGLNKDLRFSRQDRSENIRRIAEVARLFNDAGMIVITAFISPYREDRSVARQIVGPERFLEIHVNTPIETCEARDPKGMYRRARAGEIAGFTGVNAPYEAPPAPDLSIDTSIATVSECVDRILAGLTAKIALRAVRDPVVDHANSQ